MLETQSVLENVETYTYYEESDGNPLEVLLIGIDASEIGSGRTFQPPGFNDHHITTWLRKRYFFLNGTVYAQVPRRTGDFPEEARSQLDMHSGFATDISYDEKSGQLSVFYPTSSSNTTVLTWNVEYDRWTMETSEVSISDGNVDPEIFEDEDLVWSAP